MESLFIEEERYSEVACQIDKEFRESFCNILEKYYKDYSLREIENIAINAIMMTGCSIRYKKYIKKNANNEKI